MKNVTSASRSGGGSYRIKPFKFYQEMQFLTDKISSNSTTTNLRRITSFQPCISLSSALPSPSCSNDLPATAPPTWLSYWKCILARSCNYIVLPEYCSALIICGLLTLSLYLLDAIWRKFTNPLFLPTSSVSIMPKWFSGLFSKM